MWTSVVMLGTMRESMSDSQSQKVGEAALQIQAGGDVMITLGMSSEQVEMRLAQARQEITRDLLAKAEEMLRTVGVKPAPVPAKIAVPLLNYASVESDGYLRAQWVTLLANA